MTKKTFKSYVDARHDRCLLQLMMVQKQSNP